MKFDQEQGKYVRDESKVRQYIFPSLEELEDCELKPYVDPSIEVPKKVKVYKAMDYFKMMEEAWEQQPESKDLFFNTMYMRDCMGRKAKALEKFGY